MQQDIYYKNIQDFRILFNQISPSFSREVDYCMQYKIAMLNQFIATKLSLKSIIHRKVVYRIFSKYLPQKKQKLVINCQNLSLGFSERGLNILKDILSQLTFAENLELDLSGNYLGQNKQGIQEILDVLVKLCDLKRFKLNLSNNKLGQDNLFNNQKSEIDLFEFDYGTKEKNNVQSLCQNLRKLYNLEYLNLDLRDNNLGYSENDLQYLKHSFQYKYQLNHVVLNLSLDLLGIQTFYDNLKDSFQYTPQLQQLELNLKDCICQNEQNLVCLGFCLKQLVNLQNLNIYTKQSPHMMFDLQSLQSLQEFSESLYQLPKLQYLKLNFNNILQNYKLRREFRKIIKEKLSNLKEFQFKNFNKEIMKFRQEFWNSNTDYLQDDDDNYEGYNDYNYYEYNNYFNYNYNYNDNFNFNPNGQNIDDSEDELEYNIDQLFDDF